ncbi:helix-turn-helix domain-containing protein [Micromonospora haikouensis]|uniref:helix-turn-helix domain-containing protein n=1 Tax=Micromonospora haikouensis TaxID=686309 RepID=UPI00367F5F76
MPPVPAVRPASSRTRLTASLRADVVKRYEAGASTRRIAADLDIGKSTVLKILRAEVELRPVGAHY